MKLLLRAIYIVLTLALTVVFLLPSLLVGAGVIFMGLSGGVQDIFTCVFTRGYSKFCLGWGLLWGS